MEAEEEVEGKLPPPPPPPLGTDGNVCEVEVGTDGNKEDRSAVSDKGLLECGTEGKAAEENGVSAPTCKGAECGGITVEGEKVAGVEGKDAGGDKGFADGILVGAASPWGTGNSSTWSAPAVGVDVSIFEA